jgi:hypothetical protein
MRKVNKILMATISILLCLVLISTSVVSGIFAKYVVTKKGESIVSLEAFGVTLSVSEGEDLPQGVKITPTLNYANNTVAVEVSNLRLAPGDFIDDVIIFQVDGSPNVPIVDFKLKVDIKNDDSYYLGNATLLPGITGIGNAQYYSPIGFTAKTATNSARVVVLRPWEVVGTYADYRIALAQGIDDRLPSLGFSRSSNTITSRIWDTGSTAFNFNYLSFGFNCYLNGDPQAPDGKHPKDEAEAHMIQTFLQAQENATTYGPATITVTYTVTLEQG